jgi:hypothetical protein
MYTWCAWMALQDIASVFAHIEGLRKWMWDGCLIDQDINRPPNPLVILNSHDFRIAQCGM